VIDRARLFEIDQRDRSPARRPRAAELAVIRWVINPQQMSVAADRIEQDMLELDPSATLVRLEVILGWITGDAAAGPTDLSGCGRRGRACTCRRS
jgi:hypothetical protein